VLPPLSGMSHSSLMMEAARTSETSVDNYFTQQYIPKEMSELHTRRREKSHMFLNMSMLIPLMSETKFHTHTKQSMKYFCIFYLCFQIDSKANMSNHSRNSIRSYFYLNGILPVSVFLKP
jgi:hypothetical protein